MAEKAADHCEYREQLSRWENEGGALATCHKHVDENGLIRRGPDLLQKAWTAGARPQQ
jgi:post-segregation antitoxin (ccd killing protein)